MNGRSKRIKIFLIFLIALFFCVLCLLIVLQYYLKKQDANSNNNVSFVTEETSPQTIEDVIKKYESEFIKQDGNTIYVIFAKDLYDENGNSNKDFFYNLANDLTIFFPLENFEVIDEEKKIDLMAKFNNETDSHIILINDLENFYEQSDGNSYTKVEKSEIVKPSALYVQNGYLERLVSYQMFLSSIKEYLDEGKESENGYISYENGTIKLKLAPNDSVMNIIFSEDYGYSILTDVESDTPLTKIYELHNDNTFGSLSDGYLGYRSNNLYYFFYGDETSVYGYSYRRNDTFEKLLEEYLNNKDLDKFITKLSEKMLSYDVLEYDKDIKKATMIFPTRGIEIKIEDNNPKGITLYSNYYFTDMTKEMVKNGKISYSTDDLVEKYEIQRRESSK